MIQENYKKYHFVFHALFLIFAFEIFCVIQVFFLLHIHYPFFCVEPATFLLSFQTKTSAQRTMAAVNTSAETQSELITAPVSKVREKNMKMF
jgi:hypothetical protein